MILEILMQDRHRVACYAPVCHEWQTIIEQKTFSRLVLTSSRLADFQDMVHRQRGLVKYIWLCIEIQEYDCSQCEADESDEHYDRNSAIIENAISQLFVVLSTWEPSGRLLLDISVHSPSDSQHHFKNFRFPSDDTSELCDGQEQNDYHDPRHGWVNGRKVSPPPCSSIHRIFSDIEMHGDFWKTLPKVSAVTGFLLRRQNRRRWEPGVVEELIFLLPRLEEIHYEPWREWIPSEQGMTDRSESSRERRVRRMGIDLDNFTGSTLLFKYLISKQMKKIVLFEDFNDVYAAAFPLLSHESRVRTADSAVSKAIAEASLNLESLSASFIADAGLFFGACQPSWVWNKLASLTLTSRLLAPSESHGAIDGVLQDAAATAMKMPNLKTVEIWNGGKGLASLFRYQASEGSRCAIITWRGNWDLTLTPQVIRSWETVALEYAQSDVRVVKELLNMDVVIGSHGDAIHHLKLLNQVVHPVSLHQIRREAGR